MCFIQAAVNAQNCTQMPMPILTTEMAPDTIGPQNRLVLAACLAQSYFLLCAVSISSFCFPATSSSLHHAMHHYNNPSVPFFHVVSASGSFTPLMHAPSPLQHLFLNDKSSCDSESSLSEGCPSKFLHFALSLSTQAALHSLGGETRQQKRQ